MEHENEGESCPEYVLFFLAANIALPFFTRSCLIARQG
jgi:hypothetical protein